MRLKMICPCTNMNASVVFQKLLDPNSDSQKNRGRFGRVVKLGMEKI